MKGCQLDVIYNSIMLLNEFSFFIVSSKELISLKKIIPASAIHHQHHVTSANVLQQHVTSEHQQHTHPHHQQQQPQQQQQQQQQQHQQQQQQQQQQQNQAVTAQVQNIVPTINIMGLRNVQLTEQQTHKTSTPLMSRIKYSRGKIITTQGTTGGNVQIIEAHEVGDDTQTHELAEGGKFEISEIDMNNSPGPAAIFGDLVKYSEIDDIELPDGTKISVGYAPQHQLQTSTQLTAVEHDIQQQQAQQQQHHQIQTHQLQEETATVITHQQFQQLQDVEQDDATTSVEETILPDNITLHERPLTKSYTILTTRPIKQEPGLSSSSCGAGSAVGIGGDSNNTTTYELSLSDSSLQPDDTKYVCRHCGKKYRWKTTLRRHENVECGGKEPCHPCPHCSYKAKQRGNLGVHVRKHHPDKPQLESKRGRKL